MSLSHDASWRTASKCASEGACVEVAKFNGEVGVRDSRTDRSPVLRFGSDAWQAFAREAANGRYDLSN